MNWASLIWSAMSLTGVIVSIRGLLDIESDRRALGAHDGALKFLVITRQRRQYIRLFAFLVYLLVGVGALLPFNFPGEGLLLLVGLFVGLIALILNGLLEQVDRAMIRKLFP